MVTQDKRGAMNFLPEHCRGARGLLNWSQTDLALQAGISRSTVKDFEQGRHELHRATEAQIRKALEVAGVRLLGDDDGGPGVRLAAASLSRA
jgi:transcriptional regulator with XRE-family HTH domain